MKLILTPLCFTEGCKGSSTGSPAIPTLPRAHAQLPCNSTPGRGGFKKSLGLTSSFAINPKRLRKTCNVTLALVILQKTSADLTLAGRTGWLLPTALPRKVQLQPWLLSPPPDRDPGALATPNTHPGQAQQGGRAPGCPWSCSTPGITSLHSPGRPVHISQEILAD